MMAIQKKGSPTAERWAGIRTVSVKPPTPQQKIARLAEKIGTGADLTVDDRRSIASYLRCFANDREAMVRYGSQGPGRKSGGTYAPEIALDYLIQKERLGKALAARASTAKFWKVPESNVRDAFTDHKDYATLKLKEQMDFSVGRTGQRISRLGLTEDMPMTREQALKDCILDLRSWAKRQLGRNN